jgi:hypothetical protein
MADRLRNMRTLQFMPQETQLRKAREVLDIFGPVARQLRMETVGTELETLAFAALQRARPGRPSCYRAIIALDIEGSTSRPDPVKAELRTMLYELSCTRERSTTIPTDVMARRWISLSAYSTLPGSKALKATTSPLILIVSGHIYSSIVRHGYYQGDGSAFRHLVTRQIAGNRYPGWIQVPESGSPAA